MLMMCSDSCAILSSGEILSDLTVSDTLERPRFVAGRTHAALTHASPIGFAELTPNIEPYVAKWVDAPAPQQLSSKQDISTPLHGVLTSFGSVHRAVDDGYTVPQEATQWKWPLRLKPDVLSGED
jgi:hypothetical protein